MHVCTQSKGVLIVMLSFYVDDDSSMASPALHIVDGQTSPQLISEPTASLSALSRIKKGICFSFLI